jgi:uncharacterized protein (TIGR00725 family)
LAHATNDTFDLHRAAHELFDAKGRRFDAMTRTWITAPAAASHASSESVDLLAAVTWLQRDSPHPLREPIGVIGPRDAAPAQLQAAARVGERLADCGFVVMCGGRGGVMQAVCEGVARVGGTSIGLLPDADPSLANPFASIVIATGIGEARNALIARASFCLIAIGTSYGTLSEVALGRQFHKLVIGMEGAAQLDGVVHVESTQIAVEKVAEAVLGVKR